MKVTQRLKQWLVENAGLEADASDGEAILATAKALASQALSPDQYEELVAEPEAGQAEAFRGMLQQLVDSQKQLQERLDAMSTQKAEPIKPENVKSVNLEKELNKGDGEVRVKGAHEMYDATRYSLTYPMEDTKGRRHPMAGRPVTEGGARNTRTIHGQSDLDKAICGAYVKYALWSELGERGVPQALKMTDHDRQLIDYAIHELPWGGVLHGVGDEDSKGIGVHGQKLTPWQQKALIDDSTSGGLEMAPIVFDDAVITTPLLHGELFPLVNVVTLTRGRRVEGASIGNVTLSGTGGDGTAIPLFNTTNFVSAFDTTIFPVNGSIEIGLDFLSDSPVDVGSLITAQYGERLMAWLDEQISVGDGSTEPEGVTVASGTTSVSATNGNTGPPTVGDYEGLLFGVAKAYKQGTAMANIAFAANETTYRRARAIAVGATDARRVFGMDHESYTLLGHPYKINTAFANTQIVFGNFKRYRMYRRLGLTVKATTEGRTLVRANEMLITARARFGGQVEDASAFAYTSNAQS